MARHPVVLTSLEEDFKALGLLGEEGDPAPQHTDAPDGEPTSSKKSRNVGAKNARDTAYDKSSIKADNPSPHGGSSNTKTHPAGDEPEKMKESIKGMPDARRGKGGGAAKAVSGHVEANDDDEDEDEDEKDGEESDDEDDDQEESSEVRGSVAVMEAVRSLRGGAQSITESYNPKFAAVASLIEDVNSIMESIDTSRRDETVKAFANIGLVSEMLARGFANFAEEYEDEDLAEAALALAALSEDAEAIATGLNEGEEADQEALESEFRDQMDALINGLDLYSDVVESDAELEEEEGLAEADDEKDDDDDSDDDEDDSDDDEDEDDSDDDEDDEVEEDADPAPKSAFDAARKKMMAKTMGKAGTDNSGTKALDRLKMVHGERKEAYLPHSKKEARGPFVTKPKGMAGGKPQPVKETRFPTALVKKKGQAGPGGPAARRPVGGVGGFGTT